MDEPASALDPIATAKIEELIQELKQDYTIVIVTHNMQQAARVSDYTAYFYLGRLIEFGPTDLLFTNPTRPRDRGLHHGTVRLMPLHTDRAYESQLGKLRSCRPRDGRARRGPDRPGDPLLSSSATATLARRHDRARPHGEPARRRDRRPRRSSCSRCTSPRRATCGSSPRPSRSPPISSASATSPRTSPSAPSS